MTPDKIKECYHCTLETLTPLHIGSGEKLIRDLDFFIDEKNFAISVLDKDKFFCLLEEKGEDAIKGFNDAVESDGQVEWIKKNGFLSKAKAYAGEYKKSPPKQILEQIRDSFRRPYLSGSSLKGSMRTAIIQRIVGDVDNRETLEREVKKYQGQQHPSLKFADQTLCQAILGENPNQNLMRALTAGDFCFEEGALELQAVDVYRLVNKTKLSFKFPVYVEAVQAGQTAKGQISIDKYIVESDRKKNCFGFKVDFSQKWLLQAVRDRTEQRINAELDFLKSKTGLPEGGLIPFYKELLHKLKGLPENEVILPVGWGTGWNSMTGELLKEDELKSVRVNLNLAPKYLNFPFPKSRKIVTDSRGARPMGWVLLKLRPMEDVRVEKEKQLNIKREKHRMEKQAEEAAARRKAELDNMSEEDRRILFLKEGRLSGDEETDMFNSLDSLEGEAQRKTAQALKEHWQENNRWKVKKKKQEHRNKQYNKVQKVKELLGEL